MNRTLSYILSLAIASSPLLAEAESIFKSAELDRDIASTANSGNDRNDRMLAVSLASGFPNSNIPGLKHYKVILDKNNLPVRLPMGANDALDWVERFRELRSEYSARGYQKTELLKKVFTQLQLEVDLKESFDYKPVAQDEVQDRQESKRVQQAQLTKAAEAKAAALENASAVTKLAKAAKATQVAEIPIPRQKPILNKSQERVEPTVNIEKPLKLSTAGASQTTIVANANEPQGAKANALLKAKKAKGTSVVVAKPTTPTTSATPTTKKITTAQTAQSKSYLQDQPHQSVPNQKAEAKPTKIKSELEEGIPGPNSTALWIENGPNDMGHIKWIKNEDCKNSSQESTCKATTVALEESPFLVTDYYSRNAEDLEEESSFEAVRSDDKFKKDNSNVINYIPKGSLVTPLSPSNSKYQNVHIISVAEFYDNEKPAAVAKPRESGFIYKKSLQGLIFKGEEGENLNYTLSFGESSATERAKLFGLNLDSATVSARATADGKALEAIEYCGEGTCTTFLLFDVEFQNDEDRDRSPGAKWTLAISPAYLALMSSVTARMNDLGDSEESEGSDESQESEDDNADQSDVAQAEGADTQFESEGEEASAKDAISEEKEDGKLKTGTGTKSVGGVPVISGTHTKVACFESGKIKVRDFTLKPNGEVESTKEIGSINASGTPVAPVSSWTGGKLTYKINNKPVQFEKVQYGIENKVGWISSDYVKLSSECKYATGSIEVDTGDEAADLSEVNSEPKSQSFFSAFLFPLEKNVPCFKVGCGKNGRWFGARRNKGKRKHAASDLIVARGNRVRAVADGDIIMGTYYFYEGTYAVEQRLKSNGHIIRYGEIGGAGAVKKGPVKKGASIGRIGRLNMLHGEQYYGTAKGPLSRGNDGRFWRRSDLFDPTANWMSWLHGSGLSIIIEKYLPSGKKKTSKPAAKKVYKSTKSKKKYTATKKRSTTKRATTRRATTKKAAPKRPISGKR